MQITHDVYAIDASRGSYSYAFRSSDGVTLIDSSIPGRARGIADELAAHDMGDVVRILITHHDVDHVGNAAELQKQYGCDVFISETDMPYAQGTVSRPGIKGLIGVLVHAGRSTQFTPLPAEEINGIEILHTPGHTPGHVCYLYNRVLFAGDLLNSHNDVLRPSQPAMTWNKEFVKESITSLAAVEFDWVCPAHGQPVKTSSVRV
ncbi:MAG: MBL fold metallo-hydrolase [Propionibacteriaceae bacterium]|nr:MBL fold metallo-hydrolase [Propionibacteriaceae bacterium]